MTLEPLLAAPLPVQIHAATAFPTFFPGSWQIFLYTKGTQSAIWVTNCRFSTAGIESAFSRGDHSAI
jgi:uncharacterized membrane protein